MSDEPALTIVDRWPKIVIVTLLGMLCLFGMAMPIMVRNATSPHPAAWAATWAGLSGFFWLIPMGLRTEILATGAMTIKYTSRGGSTVTSLPAGEVRAVTVTKARLTHKIFVDSAKGRLLVTQMVRGGAARELAARIEQRVVKAA